MSAFNVRETALFKGLHFFLFQPGVDILPHVVFRNAVALLDESLQLVALAVDFVQIIVREIAPLLFDPALELFPVPLDTIPVHGSSPVLFDTPPAVRWHMQTIRLNLCRSLRLRARNEKTLRRLSMITKDRESW